MQDFDLRKYMSNNKLHQSDIGGFSITELQQINLDDLTEADIAYGYFIVKELNLNSEVEVLDEGLKDFVKGVKNKLKGLKPTEQLLSILFAKIKKLLPSGVKLKEVIKDLKKAAKEIDGKPTQEKLIQWINQNASLKESQQLNELGIMPNWVRNLGAGALLTLLLTVNVLKAMPSDENASDKALQNTNDVEQVMDTDSTSTPQNAVEFEDVADDLGGSASDLVNDFDTESNYLMSSVGDGGFEFWMGNGIGDIDDADLDKAIDQAIKKLQKDHPNLKKITLTDNATWTDTQGDDASDDKAVDGGSVSKDRQDTSNKLNKLLKKAIEDNFEDAEVTHVEKDAVKDTSKEFEAGSLDAEQAQKVGSNWSDIQDGEADTDDVSPDTDDTGDTDIKQANTIPPQDIIGFYSKKPDFDSNKYMVIAFQFLPRIIGNGKIANNPAFERFAKHLTIAKSGETFNDAFIKRRIGGRVDKTGGSLVKKAAKAKGREKEEILDTIDTLRWIRNTKKSPSSLSKGIKALDPNIKLGERGVIKSTIGKKGQKIPATAFKKGEQKPKAGQATRQKGSDNKGKSGLMERLEKLIPTTLQLTEITKAPGFNQDSAKENLGLLTHLFSGIWSGKDDSFIEFDNAYLEDKYKSSVDDFYTKFPSIGEKVKLKVKEKEEEDVTVKTTDADTTDTKDQTKSKTSNVKVGDTVELDPNVSKTTDKSTSKSSGKSYSDTEDEFKTIAKALSGKEKATAKQDLAKKLDYHKGEDDVTDASKRAGDELGKQTQVVKALNLINTQEELQNLIVGMLSFINPVLIDQPKKLKSTLNTAATITYDPEGVPDSERVKKEKELVKTSKSKEGEQLKLDLKENDSGFPLFSFLVEKIEDETFKDVEKVKKLIQSKPSLLAKLKLIKSFPQLEDFILAELLEKLNDKFALKDSAIKLAIKGAATIAGTGNIKPHEKETKSQTLSRKITAEQIKSLIKNILTEGLTPGQASKVKDKYKQIYSGMLKGDKKKLLKYIDPKFNRPNPDAMATGRAINLVKKDEDENVEESKTEKQRKWACAQVDSKSRPKGLSKAQAKEMCSDTDLSKNENMENTRLHELIKTALKGPVEEESFPDLTGDGKVTKADILKGRGVKLEEGTELVDKHGYEFKRFSMGEEGPGLQITSQDGNYITIPGSKLGFFASALTDAIRVFDDMSRQLPVDESLTERIFKELRGNVNEQDYKFQDAKDLTVKPLRPLLKSVAKKVADEIEKMAKSGKFQKIQDDEGAVGNADLSLALGVEVLAALQDKI